MAKPQTTEVNLLGLKLFLKSSDTDPELLQEVLQLVTLKLKEAEGRIRGGAAAHQIALLALLDIAEEYIKAKKRTSDFKQQIDQKSSQLLNLLGAEFK